MREFLVELLDAVSRSHNANTIAAAAHRVLSRRWAAESLRIRVGDVCATAGNATSGERVLLPLIDVDGANGDVSLVLAPGASRPPEDERAVVASILAAALRQGIVVGRLATLSRRAHARSRELDQNVRELVLPRSIVATAPAMRRIFTDVVPVVARQPTTVLITGETGTGKELVARRIHELSPRARGPFVRVNCGAIPSGLVESALFGHERGAFTGALGRHIGVFERAHAGTLFLDEIGELPLEAQAKLLRVLESGELERIGGERTLAVDVRVVAATHRDLPRRVREGTFREDLLYRLDVFPIRIPALRERATEIPDLARHIVAELAERLGRPAPMLDRRAIQQLRGYEWPGNVRELRNVLERSVILSDGERLEIDLPRARRSAQGVRTFADGARETIEAAVSASGGRIYGTGGAAELLRLRPTTLVSKMKRLGMVRS